MRWTLTLERRQCQRREKIEALIEDLDRDPVFAARSRAWET